MFGSTGNGTFNNQRKHRKLWGDLQFNLESGLLEDCVRLHLLAENKMKKMSTVVVVLGFKLSSAVYDQVEFHSEEEVQSVQLEHEYRGANSC